MFFTANDSIKLNMSRDDAIKLFEKRFTICIRQDIRCPQE